MPKIRTLLQSLDSQFVNPKYKRFMRETYMLKLSKSMFDIVKHTVWPPQTVCFGVSDTMSGRAKKTKQVLQRYSLTILTIIADSEFNKFLHFQRLFRFYLESFSLSKNFIIFWLKGKFRRVWHGFCREVVSKSFHVETSNNYKFCAISLVVVKELLLLHTLYI